MPIRKPSAYRGNMSYVFISYAHKDAQTVLPIIEQMQKDGYRVWYDEGIAPGSNWDAFISDRLDRCANALCFISKSYIKSQNCRDELALARMKKKPIQMIYIEDVSLTPGMKMRYGRIQSLRLSDMQMDEVLQKLYKSDHMKQSKG